MIKELLIGMSIIIITVGVLTGGLFLLVLAVNSLFQSDVFGGPVLPQYFAWIIILCIFVWMSYVIGKGWKSILVENG